jgi:hypothetical protein
MPREKIATREEIILMACVMGEELRSFVSTGIQAGLDMSSSESILGRWDAMFKTTEPYKQAAEENKNVIEVDFS